MILIVEYIDRADTYNVYIQVKACLLKMPLENLACMHVNLLGNMWDLFIYTEKKLFEVDYFGLKICELIKVPSGTVVLTLQFVT